MLVRELNDLGDCEPCPFLNEFCPGGFTVDGRGEPMEPPCVNWKDLDADLEDLYVEASRRRANYEKNLLLQWRKEEEKKAKDALAAERRRASKRHVFAETQEIKRLRDILRTNINSFEFARSFREAMSFANTLRSESVEMVDPFAEENEELRRRIAELEEIKKQKQKEFRKTYK